MPPEAGGPVPPPGAPIPPKSKGSKAPMIIGIVVVVLVVCCGGLGVAGYFSSKDGKDSSNSATGGDSSDTGADVSPSASADADVDGDLAQFHNDDCLTQKGSEVDVASCTDPGAYKVLLRVNYTTAESACAETDYTEMLYQDGSGKLHDFILCIAPVK
ncbi:MAG: hypothetical protein WCA46_30115 [Actinocatenispora sp.]